MGLKVEVGGGEESARDVHGGREDGGRRLDEPEGVESGREGEGRV